MTIPQHEEAPSYDCSALLAHVTQEESRLENVNNDMAHFGHPPAPKLGMFRLCSDSNSNSNDNGDDVVLMAAFTKRCISAQVLTRLSSSNYPQKAQAPFLVSTILASLEEQQRQQRQQSQQQVVEEGITGLTMVALEDLSLISVDETLRQVVFDHHPAGKNSKNPKITVLDSPGKTNNTNNNDSDTEHATAKIKSLQLRGRRVHLPRMAIIFGTNTSRLLSVELRWSPEQQAIMMPLSEPLNVLPLDAPYWIKKIQEDKQVPFCPIGGVNHLSTFVCHNDSKSQLKKSNSAIINGEIVTPKERPPLSPMAYVYITYGDGTMLRIHHSAFFRSVIGDELLSSNTNKNPPRDPTIIGPENIKPTLAERLNMQHVPLVLRCDVRFTKKDIAAFAIVPLPKYHPTPLSPMLLFPPTRLDETGEEDGDDSKMKEEPLEICEAVLFTKNTASAATSESFPTLCFYTSEDQLIGQGLDRKGKHATISDFSDTPILGTVLGGTRAVMGGLAGAFAWGFGSAPAPAPTEMEEADEKVTLPSVGPFSSIRKKTILKLFAGHEIHDAPRRVESFIVDPDGNLGATTDNFGRVLLVDLATKQIVRMWKGFREASCCWLQVPRTVSGSSSGTPKRKSVFLVIHSRQRRVVEVYRVRHGPRVKSIQVDRDAQIVACKEWISEPHGGTGYYMSSCYIVHANVPGTETPQLIEKISIQEHDGAHAREVSQKESHQASSSSLINPKEAALRLQRLQQLLANTNVPCQLQDVHNALLQISSLRDLATCLDRLASAPVLESKMGVRGSEFQKIVLAYCRDSLKEAVKNSKGDPASNPHVKLLATKIVWHTQVINAFDILKRFELSEKAEEEQQVAPRSRWTEEAMGWVSTYDMVNGNRIIDSQESDGDRQNPQPITFATFASACVVPRTPDTPAARDSRKIEVYLSDSSKTRREVLVHVFKPLLGDVFSFNVVNSIFGALGILEDSEYLLKCFGEWYMTLSTKEAAQKGFYSLYSPMMRWLQEMAAKQLDKKKADPNEITLQSLHSFCSDSAELVNSFMLGSLCREAVAKAALKKEEKTYGKISSAEKGKCSFVANQMP